MSWIWKGITALSLCLAVLTLCNLIFCSVFLWMNVCVWWLMLIVVVFYLLFCPSDRHKSFSPHTFLGKKEMSWVHSNLYLHIPLGLIPLLTSAIPSPKQSCNIVLNHSFHIILLRPCPKSLYMTVKEQWRGQNRDCFIGEFGAMSFHPFCSMYTL